MKLNLNLKPMLHWYNIVTVKSWNIGKTTYWITTNGKFDLIKPFTIVIYDSRVLLTRKLPILRLYGNNLCSENVYKIGYWKKMQFKRNEVIFKSIWYKTPLNYKSLSIKFDISITNWVKVVQNFTAEVPEDEKLALPSISNEHFSAEQ